MYRDKVYWSNFIFFTFRNCYILIQPKALNSNMKTNCRLMELTKYLFDQYISRLVYLWVLCYRISIVMLYILQNINWITTFKVFSLLLIYDPYFYSCYTLFDLRIIVVMAVQNLVFCSKDITFITCTLYVSSTWSNNFNLIII